MSSRHRIEFELVGNAGNIEGVLNRLNNGISRVGNSSRDASNNMGLWQRQMMAMGTTARYALAGGVVFGVTAAVGALKDFQVALGNIQTVATRPGGLQGLGGQINDLGQSLIRTSNETITPVNDLADAVVNLYSSISKDLPVKDVERLTKTFAMVARAGQVKDTRALVGSLLGGVNAFDMPKGPGQINKSVATLGDQFYRVLQRSINISGEEFAGQAGRLYSSARSGGLTAPQTGALVVQASQFGGTAASIIQNLSQLLIYLRNPKTPSAKSAYAQAGVSQNDLISGKPGAGYAILQKLIGHAQKLGVHGTLNGKPIVPGQRISDEDAANVRLSGQGARFFAQAFGRIQSQRTLAALASESLPALDKQVKSITNSGGDVKKAFDRFIQEAPLAALSNSVHNFALTSVSSLQPILNPLARGVGYATNQASAHPKITAGIEGALFAALGVNALGKYLPGKTGKILGKFGKLGIGSGAASAALTGEAVPNLLGGGQTDGTRGNPFWVIIHPASAMLSGSGTGGYGPLGGPGPGGGLGKVARRSIPRIPLAPLGAAGAILSGVALLGYGSYVGISAMIKGAPHTPLANAFISRSPSVGGVYAQRHPALASYFKDYVRSGNRSQLEMRLASNPAGLSLLHWRKIQSKDEHMAAQRATQYIRTQTGKESGAFAVEGNLSGDFTVHLVDKDGHEIGVQEKKGVPTKLWGARTVPQHRGKPKDTRKGH